MLSNISRQTLPSQLFQTKQLQRFCSTRVQAIKYIKTNKPVSEYTREVLRRKAEDPEYEHRILKEEFQKEVDERKEYVHNQKANDKNPKNFVKVRILNSDLYNEENVDQSRTLLDSKKQIKRPFIQHVTPQWKLQGPIIKAKRIGIKGSVKKVAPTMKKIIGLHILDAMNVMSKVRKRAAEPILKTLGQARLHAIHRGFDENKLFVQSALTNKQKSRTFLYYHAKGRSGKMRKDWVKFTINLEEKPANQFFKMMIGGQCPPGLAAVYKTKLLEADADLDEVRQLYFLLTAQGRHKRKIMIRRKAYMRMKEYETKGVHVTMRVMKEKILEEESQTFQEDYEKFRAKRSEVGLTERRQIFESNEKTNS